MKKLTFIKLLTILCVGFFALSVNAESIKLKTYVTDNANMIPDNEQSILENKLSEFDKQTTNQIVVVTIPSLPSDETIETYAYKIFNENGIGQKTKNNGLLFLISLNDRKNRFETGYGLEPIIPDVYTGRLQRDVIASAFRKGDYIGGINQSLDQIIERINSGQVYVNNDNEDLRIKDEMVKISIFLIFIFLQIIINVFSKSKSYWAGGVLGLVIGAFIYLITGFILAFGLITIGLFLDIFASKYPKFFKSFGIWHIGGGGRGGFGGGFSGGGGRSGGGGSSGSW